MATYTEVWRTLPWDKFQRNVFRLQKRIYRAIQRGAVRVARNLQRLLLRSWSARCLAVRRVTQDNRGKRTPGVDGVANLRPAARVVLARSLRDLSPPVDGVRRLLIPKSNGERRPLGIPTIRDRARQALVLLVLEPEWEARFEPNSYGFRPGRSCHDAIEAIFNYIRLQPKYVLDADIAACFDTIAHEALPAKLHAILPIERLVRAWLKADILQDGVWQHPTAGTPQGGVISPLLANVALHGLEAAIVAAAPRRPPAALIQYADDLVILHPDLEVLERLQAVAREWLAPMGLMLNTEKTHLTHTLHEHEGRVGIDFLGFTVRQYPVGKYRSRRYRERAHFKTLIKPSRAAQQRHVRRLKQLVRQYQGAAQAGLIGALNPRIRGWARYYRTKVAKRVFGRLDSLLHQQLVGWTRRRHPHKTAGWRYQRYWQRRGPRSAFTDGTNRLALHADTPIQRHVKVQGARRPYDGDWLYWGTRLGRDPSRPVEVTKLLKQQRGRCAHCGLTFTTEDRLEVHHVNGNRTDNRLANLMLLHRHCHDRVHAGRSQ